MDMPRVWQLVLVGAASVAAVALLASGAILIRVPRDLAPALIQLGFASIIGGAAFSVARQKPLPADTRLWVARAAAGVLVTLIVLFSLAEGLLR